MSPFLPEVSCLSPLRFALTICLTSVLNAVKTSSSQSNTFKDRGRNSQHLHALLLVMEFGQVSKVMGLQYRDRYDSLGQGYFTQLAAHAIRVGSRLSEIDTVQSLSAIQGSNLSDQQ